MGGFDLTDIGGNSQGVRPQEPRPIQRTISHTEEDFESAEDFEPAPSKEVVPGMIEVEGHVIKVGNPAAREIKKEHWDITDSKGQIQAGEVTKEQTEFLKNTEWVE